MLQCRWRKVHDEKTREEHCCQQYLAIGKGYINFEPSDVISVKERIILSLTIP